MADRNPLTLPAQLRNLLRRNISWRFGRTKRSQLIDPGDKVAEPCGADSADWRAQSSKRRQSCTGRNLKQLVEGGNVSGREPSDQPLDDDALRFDHRARAELLEGGRRWGDDFSCPQRGHEALRKSVRVGYFERSSVKTSDHLSAGGAYEWAIAELSLQCCGMLIARVFSDTLAFDAAPAFTDLTSDRAQHRLGYQFAWLKKAAGIAQSAELESEAEPVLRLAATPDAQKILVAQRMMSRAGAIIRRQREERPPLSGGENAPVRHDGLLRVCEILFA
jgi:hypothetical protein